ncbi:GNAT family N-acetyltransferase [Sphingobium sp. CCH11-B1]|jgi:CelD/BcsL family acetyltransferase involved in cellulose biosynthesis|uniref:GNAT family N-acetyltransferase n=1 Tax=Sphingobium sp. CCH11-B1 TaxID=1768781 RepID=UPI000833E737|nr:GNAT family N-acetyltransferase [Sphingobium sp. CCH11-B1]MEA3388859.1 GNAT family N-acetyltransferase [Pseudomonadota bacterium]
MSLAATFTQLDRSSLARRWQALEARSDASFFLRWTWIGAWLDSYPVTPELIAVTRENGEDIALALLGHAMMPRLLGSAATLSLNQSGDAAADRPYIEYNGLLVARGKEEDAAQAVLAALMRRRDWRILRLGGVVPGSPLLQLPARRHLRVDVSPVYQVDLGAVRSASGDYLSLLSANTRSQIRRAMKDRDSGLPHVTVATLDEIGPWLTEMAALNAGRHADNAWDDEGFRSFVATLAARGLTTGDVELLRLDDAGGIVGLLLNFVQDGVAMNYQSAFAEARSAKDKPGLLCHAAAVGHYADRGLSRYSLLAGKDRYKQSLSTCEEQLEWWQIERVSPRLELEAILRRLFRRPASA